MKVSNTFVGNATIKQLHRYSLLHTKKLSVEESNTLVDMATIKQLEIYILHNTKSQSNVTIKQLHWLILSDTVQVI